MSDDWTIEWQDGSKLDKADNGAVKLTTILRYQNKEVMRKQAQMGRNSLTALCAQYNASGYVPKGLGIVCVADLPPKDREGHIHKMAMGIEEGLPLIMSPEENMAARRKYKGE